VEVKKKRGPPPANGFPLAYEENATAEKKRKSQGINGLIKIAGG